MGKQHGFHIIELAIILAIVGIMGTVGYMFYTNANPGKQSSTVKTSDGKTKERVVWAYDQNKQEWFAQIGTPTKCVDPFKFDVSPIDMSQVWAVAFPGTYRGSNYKPHGAFRLPYEKPDGNVAIKVPTDAILVGLVRYYEQDELQYLLTFETDCGIAFRFDHLQKLTPAFQAIAETVPAPKNGDTSTSPDDAPDPIAFKAGETIATAVGLPKTLNFGFDFGVYDYRQRNEISKNAKWAAIHRNYSSLDYHGVCWFDMLPGDDAIKATERSEITINPQKPNLLISDYCKNAKHTTLEFNNGQPVDG